ncbi:hypothetical protein TWF281_001688 [Arthrobotrys megalospora]
MLVEKGMIEHPVGLWGTLEELFGPSFFGSEKPPTSDFQSFFTKVVLKDRRGPMQQKAEIEDIRLRKTGLIKLFDPSSNRIFKQKSMLNLYHNANWLPDFISDEEIPPLSLLGSIRISRTKRTTDPLTGNATLEDTVLVKRAKALGMTDESLLAGSFIRDRLKDDKAPLELYRQINKEYKMAETKEDEDFDDAQLLDFIKKDLISDICGELRPLSSLNYIWVVAKMMMLFMRVEGALAKCRNKSWRMLYEEAPRTTREKRASLSIRALSGDDEELMQVFAAEFQNPRSGFMDSIYWEDLDDLEKFMGEDDVDPEDSEPACSLM